MTDSHSFTVILAVIVAATAMTTIAPQIINLTKAASSAEEMFRTIDRKSEIDPMSEEGLVPSTCEGVIEIKDVAFAYPARPDIPVLKGLTLSAPAHKTTALVTLRRTLVQSIKWHDTHGRH
jgi:ATP-binding cassette subfamily B (MDR/TAP) protein 1